MINFEKYIKEALYDFDFFIVPGLGAFIASFAQASIDDSGQLIEPVKSFTFNGLLASDDEKKFINYVLKKEHKPISEIELQLKEFVFELKSLLNKNEKIILADDCILTYDEESDTLKGEFKAETNYYSKPDFEEISEESTFVSELPAAEGSKEIEEELEETTDSKEQVVEEEESAAIPIILDEPEEAIIDQQPEIVNDQLSEIEESYEEEYEEVGTNWGKYLIYILPLLLIFAGLYYVMIKRPFEKGAETALEESTTTVVTPVDSTISEEEISEDSSEAVAEENSAQPLLYREGRVSDQRKYPFEVAAGLFKSESNANGLLEKMKNAGFNAEIRLINGMRRVYVGVNTVEEAEAMSNKIEEFTGLTSVYFDENGVSNK